MPVNYSTVLTVVIILDTCLMKRSIKMGYYIPIRHCSILESLRAVVKLNIMYFLILIIPSSFLVYKMENLFWILVFPLIFLKCIFSSIARYRKFKKRYHAFLIDNSDKYDSLSSAEDAFTSMVNAEYEYDKYMKKINKLKK